MRLITKTLVIVFLLFGLWIDSVNGQREESYTVQKEKEGEAISIKTNGWKGEKVILLPSVIGPSLWCNPDFGNENLYHLIRFHGATERFGSLPARKYAGKTGIIIDTYLDDNNNPYAVILLDSTNEQIDALGERIGFFSELDIAKSLVGRTLYIENEVSLGISAEYCIEPDRRPRYKLQHMMQVTVTRAEWGTDLQHIHLFVKIKSGEELLFDGYDGYDYFDERYNIPDKWTHSGNYTRRFSGIKSFAEEFKKTQQQKAKPQIEKPEDTSLQEPPISTSLIKTSIGNFKVTKIQESDRFPPDCDKSLTAGCDNAMEGYKVLVIWLKSEEGKDHDIGFKLYENSAGVYVLSEDGSHTDRFSGGMIEEKLFIAFTPLETSKKFMLYWPDNSPIILYKPE